MKRIILKADSGSQAERKKLVTDGLESGITDFILRKGDEIFERLGVMNAIYSPAIHIIDSPESAEKALEGAGEELFVDFGGNWKVIPLENILAAAESKGIKVYAMARTAEEADLYLNVLERGADGIIVEKVSSVRARIGKIELTDASVESVKPVGNGDRVCVDTCSVMSPGEGMLVGSQSGCLVLVQSESEENGYVATRPFRVNAGAVHSYIKAGQGTKYLSELESGDVVSVCRRDGTAREAAVGRCKIESRPLLMVSFSLCGKKHSVMLQNAETVKLVTADGSISVTELKKGDRILAYAEDCGRHFGMPVKETIREI